MMDTTNGGLLNSFQHLLSDIFIPALNTMNYGWGEMSSSQKGANIKQDFIASLEGFVSVLSGAQQSLMEKVSSHLSFSYFCQEVKELKNNAKVHISTKSTIDKILKM